MTSHLVHTNDFSCFKTMENGGSSHFEMAFSLIFAPSIGTPAGLSW
jgi:hypothetical protein